MAKMYYVLFLACGLTSLGWGLTMGVIALNTFQALDNSTYTLIILINLGLGGAVSAISSKEEWFSVVRRNSNYVFAAEAILYLAANSWAVMYGDLKTRWIIQSVFSQIAANMVDALWEDVKTKEVGMGRQLTAKRHLFETVGQAIGMVTVLAMHWLGVQDLSFNASMVLMSVVAVAEGLVMGYVVYTKR